MIQYKEKPNMIENVIIKQQYDILIQHESHMKATMINHFLLKIILN
jgi:hypothetical protein